MKIAFTHTFTSAEVLSFVIFLLFWSGEGGENQGETFPAFLHPRPDSIILLCRLLSLHIAILTVYREIF